MEDFVAVKPILDYQVGIASSALMALMYKHIYDSPLEDSDVTSVATKRVMSSQLYSRLLSSLKRDALLFDKICILDTQEYGNPSTELLTEIEWLLDKNIVSYVNIEGIEHYLASRPGSEEFVNLIRNLKLPAKSLSKKYNAAKRPLDKEFYKIRKGITSEKHDERVKAVEGILALFLKYDELVVRYSYPAAEFITRTHALILEHFENKMAIPLLSYKNYLQKLPNSNRSIVAQVVIQDLPLPDSDTPWEKIIEYRENHDNKKSLLRLRRWIRKLSAENLSIAESKQELDDLKNQFQEHMDLHKIQSNVGTFEALIKTSLETLENLVTVKFSKLADPLFAVKKRKIALMEAEINAPGREIAYLIKSKQEFE